MGSLLEERVRKALRRKRIPSDKERQKKAAKRGGFDTSDIDDKALREIEKTHGFCYWCQKQSLKATADDTHKSGQIKMLCTTPGCPNNPDTEKVQLAPHMKNKYARLVDGKLCHDLGKLLLARDPSRLWATKKNIVL